MRGTCLEAVSAASAAYSLVSCALSEPMPTACFTLSMMPSAWTRKPQQVSHC